MPVFIMYTLNLSYNYHMIFIFFASKTFIVSKFFSKNKHEKLNLHSCKKEEKRKKTIYSQISFIYYLNHTS